MAAPSVDILRDTRRIKIVRVARRAEARCRVEVLDRCKPVAVDVAAVVADASLL